MLFFVTSVIGCQLLHNTPILLARPKGFYDEEYAVGTEVAAYDTEIL